MNQQELESELRDINKSEIRRYTTKKYQYYAPIGKTTEFLDKAFSGKYFVSTYLAANGVGKTAVICNILAHLQWPSGNPYFQQPLMKKWPYPLRRARIISDPTTVKATTVPSLKEWFPEGRYRTEKMQKSYEYMWTGDTGWEFDIMTYDQAVKEFESVNLDLAIFDEPPPMAIFEATVARMRRGGMILILCTPLNNAAWLYDKVVVNENREKEKISLTTADMEDACKIHGERGFLDHEQIETMISMWDEDEISARAFGKFKHLSGLIFKRWDTDVHVVEPFDLDPSEFSVIEAFDSHPRNPDALMWLAVRRDGTMFIVDETYENFEGTGSLDGFAKLAAEIREKRKRKRVVRELLEPAAYTKDQHFEASLSEKLLGEGFGYEPASKRRHDGIRLVRDALRYQMKGGRLIVPPKLYVFSSCVRTIWEFGHWKWTEWSVSQKDKKSPREVAEDKDDHMMENIGRILLSDPEFVEITRLNLPIPSMPSHDPYESGLHSMGDPYI